MVFALAGILEDGRAPLVKSASVAATEVIRAAIADGRLEPGRRLKEEELARELGISRTPVREALLVLQTEGLLASAPNRGATVRAYEPEEIEEMYELRALLEGHAAHRAALRIEPEDVPRLHQSNARFASLGAADHVLDLIEENLVFHKIILEAAGSERLAAMVRKVIELPLVYKSFFWYSADQKLISYHYHQQLAHALEARDAERAELIMKEHVFEARDFLIAKLRNVPSVEAGHDPPLQDRKRP
jgi:DNA-binding GntR family transcriptional regulator